MPKVQCTCGEVIDLSEVLVPGEVCCFSAGCWDHVVDRVAAAITHSGAVEMVRLREAISDALAGEVSSFYVCRRCGRLVFPEPISGLTHEYAPAHPTNGEDGGG